MSHARLEVPELERVGRGGNRNMQSKATTIPEYLESLGEEQRIVIKTIVSLVGEIHPGLRGCMRYGMPSYEIDGRIFAFNAQKNHFAIHAEPELVTKHKAELKGREVGKGCIGSPAGKRCRKQRSGRFSRIINSR